MEKFLEYTKSFTSLMAFGAIMYVAVFSVNALNPISKLQVIGSNQNVAGLQIYQSQHGNIKVKNTTENITEKNNIMEFSILPGQIKIDAGKITLSNIEDRAAYTYISANMPPDLNKNIRIELIDEDNKILLSDFKKSFEKQKISFNKQTSRTFTVRYILENPLNYVSLVTLNLL